MHSARARATVAAAAALLLYGGFVFLQLRKVAFDASHFVVAGDQFTDRELAPRSLAVEPRSAGYDGQFYYRLAISPFSRAERVAGVRFDYAVYRSQRIIYPLVAGLLAAHDPALVVWTMILVGLLAVGVLAGAAATTLTVPRAIVVALYPGLLLTIARDLVEGLEIALVLAALAALMHGRRTLAIALFTIALLTKETAILAIFAVIVTELDLYFAIPIAAYVIWKAFLFHFWHLPFKLVSGAHFEAPLAGFFRAVMQTDRLFAIEAILLTAFTVIVIWSLRRSGAPRFVKIAWLLYAALVALLGSEFWPEDWAFLRPATDFGVLGTFIVMRAPRTGPAIACAAIVAGGWIALAWHVTAWR